MRHLREYLRKVCQSDDITCVTAPAFDSKIMAVFLPVKIPSFFSDENKCFKQLL